MNLLTVVIVVALLLTVGTLIVGVGTMGFGGERDARNDTKLMFARVGMQAITLVLLLFAIYLSTV